MGAPPRRDSFSTSTTRCPTSASARAAASPDGPAPTTSTGLAHIELLPPPWRPAPGPLRHGSRLPGDGNEARARRDAPTRVVEILLPARLDLLEIGDELLLPGAPVDAEFLHEPLG